MKQPSSRFLPTFALLLFVLTLGCGRNSPSTDRKLSFNLAPPTEAVPPTTRQEPTKLEDHSLTTDEYLHLGLPADDRQWSSIDLVKVQQVLTALSKKDPRELPRYQSGRSGKLFARLTADDNLDLCRNTALPISARFQEGMNFLGAFGAIYKLYLTAFLEKQMDGAEVIETMAAVIQVSIAMIEVANEFLPTIPKDDPNYAKRIAGLQKMKQGFAITVNGALLMLTERDNYRTNDRVRFAEELTKSLPRIIPHLLPGSRTEFTQRLDSMSSDPELKDLQPPLGKLRDAVKKAVDNAK